MSHSFPKPGKRLVLFMMMAAASPRYAPPQRQENPGAASAGMPHRGFQPLKHNCGDESIG